MHYQHNTYQISALSRFHRILTDRFKSFTGFKPLEHDQIFQKARDLTEEHTILWSSQIGIPVCFLT